MEEIRQYCPSVAENLHQVGRLFLARYSGSHRVGWRIGYPSETDPRSTLETAVGRYGVELAPAVTKPMLEGAAAAVPESAVRRAD